MQLQVGDASQALEESGCALLLPQQVRADLRAPLDELDRLSPSWDRLPRDAYLRDGGRYRHRRHSCFVQELTTAQLIQVPHRAHWQPTDYNALHGGMERWFEPIEPAVAANSAWQRFVLSIGETFARARAAERWYIEAHQFRIDTAEGIGRPTPEGAHRDGVDFVAVTLVKRINVRGGETRVFDAQGTAGVRFTMLEPWTTLLLDDARVIHETTPIQPEGDGGLRDTLVLTYRAEGFQSPVDS
ncbi:2OG-Fe dioxygenase family protein [Povalibacter sp.]|uniref:2OG-Fe dioxygenase family protein n=1 Tax=Povalibacter sp. TaxID=1962978 RepID=UPI002F426B3D